MDVAETARFQISLQLCKEIWHDLGVLFQIRPLIDKFTGKDQPQENRSCSMLCGDKPFAVRSTRIEAVNFR